jgi:hypothetical protein
MCLIGKLTMGRIVRDGCQKHFTRYPYHRTEGSNYWFTTSFKEKIGLLPIFPLALLQPFSRRARNFCGSFLGYGGCSHCGDSWRWKREHLIPFLMGKQMFPLCEECFNKLDKEEVLGYCIKLIQRWARDPFPLEFDVDEAISTIKSYLKSVKGS